MRLKLAMLLCFLLTAVPMQSEASVFSDALAKARKIMQSAFQLSFLPDVPVVFYKDSFNKMFEYTNKSIDDMNLKYGDRTITAAEFQDDKATHIKKSAELALHIKSLIGSAHLAYGITMVVGYLKEALDGSFLNPGGSRSKEDIYADRVGASAVFGQKKFDASLKKHLGSFVNPDPVSSAQDAVTKNTPGGSDEQVVETVVSPFAEKSLQIGGTSDDRQSLLKRYYEAAEKGDAAMVQKLAAELQALP